MSTFIVYGKFARDSQLSTLGHRSQAVKEHIMSQAPALTGKWTHKYKVFGNPAVDTLDVVTSDNLLDVERAAEIISHHGHCNASVAEALPWLDYMRQLTGSADHPAAKPPSHATARSGGPKRGYALFTRFQPDHDVKTLPQRSLAVRHNIAAELPTIGHWACDLVVFGGPFDAVDVIETNSVAAVSLAASLIRRHGQCSIEVAPILPWNEYLDGARQGRASS